MTLYVEPVAVAVAPDGRRISRRRADSVSELDSFARSVQIKGKRVAHATVPAMGHYELTWRDRRRAIRAGASECDWPETYRRLAQSITGAVSTGGSGSRRTPCEQTGL